jgi:hypothetical protein
MNCEQACGSDPTVTPSATVTKSPGDRWQYHASLTMSQAPADLTSSAKAVVEEFKKYRNNRTKEQWVELLDREMSDLFDALFELESNVGA